MEVAIVGRIWLTYAQYSNKDEKLQQQQEWQQAIG